VESLDGLSCVNNSDCWALASTASGSVVIATTDGGSTWAPQTLPSGVEVRDGISCASTSDC
jgi:photosystem II stability/assembly factor-like uncharacterized protein